MATFIRAGAHWINLDQVASVQLVDNNADGVVTHVNVTYVSGTSQAFKGKEEVDVLVAFLRSHKVQ